MNAFHFTLKLLNGLHFKIGVKPCGNVQHVTTALCSLNLQTSQWGKQDLFFMWILTEDRNISSSINHPHLHRIDKPIFPGPELAAKSAATDKSVVVLMNALSVPPRTPKMFGV